VRGWRNAFESPLERRFATAMESKIDRKPQLVVAAARDRGAATVMT
jgi:hypothetical protein